MSRAFNTPGTFTYYCVQHQDVGMTGTVVVNTAPGGGGGGHNDPLPGVPGGSALAPVVTHFGMTRSRFRVGKESAFEFRLSRTATVRIAISRVLAGHVGKKRYAGKGTLVRRDRRAGANTVPFTGRVGR